MLLLGTTTIITMSNARRLHTRCTHCTIQAFASFIEDAARTGALVPEHAVDKPEFEVSRMTAEQ